jgi:hypothetical protein
MNENLRERAAIALREKEAVLAEEQAANLEAMQHELLCEQLQSDFERALRKITDEDYVASSWRDESLTGMVGEFRFVPYIPSKEYDDPVLCRVRLIGQCPNCGAEAHSRSIGDLVDLGKQLENFTPTTRHECELKIYPETSHNFSIVDRELPYSESGYSLDLPSSFFIE